eukprot:1191080-Prorocentrum_minimum.AAC.3
MFDNVSPCVRYAQRGVCHTLVSASCHFAKIHKHPVVTYRGSLLPSARFKASRIFFAPPVTFLKPGCSSVTSTCSSARQTGVSSSAAD